MSEQRSEHQIAAEVLHDCAQGDSGSGTRIVCLADAEQRIAKAIEWERSEGDVRVAKAIESERSRARAEKESFELWMKAASDAGFVFSVNAEGHTAEHNPPLAKELRELSLQSELENERADADRRVAEVLEAYSKRPTREEYDKALADVGERDKLLEEIRKQADEIGKEYGIAAAGPGHEFTAALVCGIGDKVSEVVAEMLAAARMLRDRLRHYEPVEVSPFRRDVNAAIEQAEALAKHSEAEKAS